MRSPWATRHNERETGAEPDYAPQETNAYASPGLTGENGYTDSPSGGWGASLRTSPTGIPDGARVGEEVRREYRPDPALPPDTFWQTLDQDRDIRYGYSERVDGNGWLENKRGVAGTPDPLVNVYTRYAPNPRATPPPEPRITSALFPRTYSYERPFDQHNRPFPDAAVGSARTFNGLHFSMADHRREYDILGMAPQRRPGYGTRNTYRLDPPPWDANIRDEGPEVQPVQQVLTSLQVPPSSRSYRLGG